MMAVIYGVGLGGGVGNELAAIFKKKLVFVKYVTVISSQSSELFALCYFRLETLPQ